jgi:uracil-DNA glycosylase
MTTDIFKNKIDDSWLSLFQSPLGELYIQTLTNVITDHPKKDDHGFNVSKQLGFKLLPKIQNILQPFRSVNLNDLKVVMIFDQPMENVGCTGIPLELQDKFPRIRTDILDVVETTYQLYKDDIFTTFNANEWMKQGVLLINASMTREMVNPDNHISYWLRFTQSLINSIHEYNNNCLFVCIGNVSNLSFPEKANVIYTPKEVCKTREEREIFHRYCLFDKINQELKTIDESLSINW